MFENVLVKFREDIKMNVRGYTYIIRYRKNTINLIF